MRREIPLAITFLVGIFMLVDYFVPHHAVSASAEELKRNRMGALILFTSLGIPMIAEGQEFGRSKGGMSNSHDAGDRVNAVRSPALKYTCSATTRSNC